MSMTYTHLEATSVSRTGSQGSWTGRVADMQMLNLLKQRTNPEYFLEEYPRHRAISLNTWLSRFGVYSNGMFLELDRTGSNLVKQAIKKSSNHHGYVMRITGIRKGNKINVTDVAEVNPSACSIATSTDSFDASRLRGQFASMGI